MAAATPTPGAACKLNVGAPHSLTTLVSDRVKIAARKRQEQHQRLVEADRRAAQMRAADRQAAPPAPPASAGISSKPLQVSAPLVTLSRRRVWSTRAPPRTTRPCSAARAHAAPRTRGIRSATAGGPEGQIFPQAGGRLEMARCGVSLPVSARGRGLLPRRPHRRPHPPGWRAPPARIGGLGFALFT